MYSAKKSGRAYNGLHRDAGVIIHAVTRNEFPSWQKAICGTSPGRRGNGWDYGGIVNCKLCLKKLRDL